ncbi:alanyl-tRNA synthetase [Endozoicomonas montiporae]|uniref:Alanine--tRNA ligase n=2 Tax=Endozoicomonas montiporae TaxID=1027273 RepID=A0A081NBJ4_9GAMM|nr:alanine--tRNA ligase [Endozoicomonas montiporae]AMO56102.1 alanyl-tRNA synthetase, class IIc [Endozoicomonas montiporae CL-33]KEQ15817.1 alanyl-tRNA synthetase [Endozoicomonas montiporae]
MKSSEIRSAFLNFFKERGHEIVPSSSLVPHDDPTLLFTNAGMNQFKDTFLGRENRAYTRATTSQKCVRAGGKHNDLENVGYTARHHTFFEMLGNFSFGDYFKQDAIQYAWEFLTGTLNLPADKLCVTVYETDDEAYNIWLKEVGVPADNIIRIGDNKGAPYASDNFWQMGDTGPCGPCTEVFYDHGDHIRGGRPGTPEEDGDRFIEIWNIVFMQYNRQADGTMEPLPKPSVDTGMGLERISTILQGGHSNYDIDIFQGLLNDASKLLGGVDTTVGSLRVIADHIRSSAFLISDGVMPSNESRGYTLRRIIRRACRHGHKLGATETFFYKLVGSLVREMGDAYPELKSDQAQIERILLQEEEQFTKTLDKGMRLLEDKLSALDGSVIPGDVVFTLYDTYGFPVDLTEDIARERELTVDTEGFNQALEAQRERARAASKFGMDYNEQLTIDGVTEFTGYQSLQGGSAVKALFVEGQAVNSVTEGQQATVVLEATPFYAESGGQVGDTGNLTFAGGAIEVLDTLKQGDSHLHIARILSGELNVGDKVEAEVNAENRHATALNHSATHLLHAALRKVLGDHVTQKGSLVDPERLRFDFSHFEAVKPEELRAIERMVNEQIRANTEVTTELLDMEAAQKKGAMALFGEKYGDEVRVLSMGAGNFSVELCGGTHVVRTGDIGSIRILAESGIAAGVRRIEAVTGQNADERQESLEDTLKSVAALVKGSQDSVLDKVKGLLEQNRKLEKEMQQLKQKLASAGSADLLSKAVEVNGVKVLATAVEGVDPKSLRDMVDQLKNKLESGIVFLAVPAEGKFPLAAGVTKDLTGKVKAGDLLKMVAEQVGGKGGGRPDFAQGGGSQPEHLNAAIESIAGWLEAKL